MQNSQFVESPLEAGYGESGKELHNKPKKVDFDSIKKCIYSLVQNASWVWVPHYSMAASAVLLQNSALKTDGWRWGDYVYLLYSLCVWQSVCQSSLDTVIQNIYKMFQMTFFVVLKVQDSDSSLVRILIFRTSRGLGQICLTRQLYKSL